MPLRRGNDQAFLLHPMPHDFFRKTELLPAQCRPYPSITVAAVFAFEDICDGKTGIRMLVSAPQPSPTIKASASRVFSRLLRSGRSTPRPVFSSSFDLLQDVVFKQVGCRVMLEPTAQCRITVQRGQVVQQLPGDDEQHGVPLNQGLMARITVQRGCSHAGGTYQHGCRYTACPHPATGFARLTNLASCRRWKRPAQRLRKWKAMTGRLLRC